jgi:small-conductance mechanosensitive channel
MKQLFKFCKPIAISLILILWMSIEFSAIASGQETKEENSIQEVQNKFAPVIVDCNKLFYVRGLTSFPAEERAAVISQRIEKASSDRSLPADSLKVIELKDQLKIYAGKDLIMIVTNADAQAESVDRMILAGFIHQKIRAAIISYRYERSSPVLLRNLWYALGAAILLTIILFVLLRLIRWLNKGLENRIRSRIASMEDKSFHIIRSAHLWQVIGLLFKTLKIVVIVLIIGAFFQYILGLFPFTKGIAAYTLSLFLNPIKSMGNSLINFLPSLAFLLIIYIVTRYVLRLIKIFFSGIHDGGIKLPNFDPEWAMPTFKILRAILIVFAVVIAYPYIPGSETSAFKGISVFLGVLLSLGSSSFISNIIAGYSMTYRGAFKNGDLIQVDDQIGYVEEQRLLVTRMRTRKNEEISIPNSYLLNSNIINYSKRAKDLGLIIHTTVGIGYETPWRLVDAMLKEAAGRTEGLLNQPPPFVLKKSLDNFAVTYEINVYCDDASKMQLYYSLLHQNILDLFNENNVQIMTPAYEGDPETPKVVPKEQWHTRLAGEK